MNPPAQPFAQLGQLPDRQLIIQIGNLGLGGLPKLSGNQIAQGIGWKVTNHSRRPMHVLQHAIGVVGPHGSGSAALEGMLGKAAVVAIGGGCTHDGCGV